MEQLKWISTTGGPLVLATAESAGLWSGIFNREPFVHGELVLAKDFMDPNEADYGRACTVNDYLGIVPVGNENVLVLGDEPMMTTVFLSKTNEPCIARWHSGESIVSVENYLSEFDATSQAETDTPLDFYLAADKQLLFDSSACLQDLQPGGEDNLELTIRKGNYLIRTYNYEPDDVTFLIIHQFKLKS